MHMTNSLFMVSLLAGRLPAGCSKSRPYSVRFPSGFMRRTVHGYSALPRRRVADCSGAAESPTRASPPASASRQASPSGVAVPEIPARKCREQGSSIAGRPPQHQDRSPIRLHDSMASPRQAAVRVADRLVESLCKAPGVGSGHDAELVAMKLREAPRDGPSTAIELFDELGRNARGIFAISHGQQCCASPLESRQFSRQAFRSIEGPTPRGRDTPPEHR